MIRCASVVSVLFLFLCESRVCWNRGPGHAPRPVFHGSTQWHLRSAYGLLQRAGALHAQLPESGMQIVIGTGSSSQLLTSSRVGTPHGDKDGIGSAADIASCALASVGIIVPDHVCMGFRSPRQKPVERDGGVAVRCRDEENHC